MKNLRRKIYALVETVDYKDLKKQKYDVFDVFMVILIVLNIGAVILETVQSIHARFALIFRVFEIFSVAVFTIEYVLRLWACTEKQEYKDPIKGRIKYGLSFMAIVDLFSFLPFYLPMFIPFDLRFLRALRLFRFIRILKISHYSEAMMLFGKVLKARKAELTTAVFAILILLVISSSLIYFVEHEAQPDKFSSIPASMWWGIVTLTTVGYGDVYPVTTLGKFIASIMSVLGIGLFALPAGILSAGFVEELRAKTATAKKCPQCGAKL